MDDATHPKPSLGIGEVFDTGATPSCQFVAQPAGLVHLLPPPHAHSCGHPSRADGTRSPTTSASWLQGCWGPCPVRPRWVALDGHADMALYEDALHIISCPG